MNLWNFYQIPVNVYLMETKTLHISLDYIHKRIVSMVYNLLACILAINTIMTLVSIVNACTCIIYMNTKDINSNYFYLRYFDEISWMNFYWVTIPISEEVISTYWILLEFHEDLPKFPIFPIFTDMYFCLI